MSRGRNSHRVKIAAGSPPHKQWASRPHHRCPCGKGEDEQHDCRDDDEHNPPLQAEAPVEKHTPDGHDRENPEYEDQNKNLMPLTVIRPRFALGGPS
jgi:hypothetical protein